MRLGLIVACLSAAMALEAIGQPIPLAAPPPPPTNGLNLPVQWQYTDTNAVSVTVYTNDKPALSVPYPTTSVVLSNLDSNAGFYEYKLYAKAVNSAGSNSLPSNVVYFAQPVTNRYAMFWAVSSTNLAGPWVKFSSWPAITVTNLGTNLFIKIVTTNWNQ